MTDVVTVSSHLRIPDVRTYMSVEAAKDVSTPDTPVPAAADEHGRSAQTFLVDAVVRSGGSERRAVARGRDIYAVTAPLAVEAGRRALQPCFENSQPRPPRVPCLARSRRVGPPAHRGFLVWPGAGVWGRLHEAVLHRLDDVDLVDVSRAVLDTFHVRALRTRAQGFGVSAAITSHGFPASGGPARRSHYYRM